MKTYSIPYPDINAGVLALGTFDGVHLGHAAVIKTAVSIAREHGEPATVWCFSAPPRAVFDDSVIPLVTPAEKAALIAALGVDAVVMPLPSRALLETEPRGFLDALTGALRPSRVVVGFNFTYGRGARGSVPDLAAYLEEKGIPITVVPPVTRGGVPVSSTAIRAAMADGDIDAARALLGR